MAAPQFGRMRAGFASEPAQNDSKDDNMAELIGQPGFAPPKAQQTPSRRRQAIMIELVATAALTVSLIVAATAVSMGNKLLTRTNVPEKTIAHLPLSRQ
jgi:hypothetical protein